MCALYLHLLCTQDAIVTTRMTSNIFRVGNPNLPSGKRSHSWLEYHGIHIFSIRGHFPASYVTLPETNSSPLNIGHPKRKGSYSNHPFSGANLLLVSGRVVYQSINLHLSSVENPVDIPLNPDWLIGILILVYYNPHI